MKSTITRTKICLYLLLAVMTGVFAFISFTCYIKDLESRIHPQIERAIVQVSKVLPQLKENEEALREVSSKLENSRQQLVHDNEDLTEDQAGNDGENVETVIDETLSWMNRITKLRVGRGGHVIVVSKKDYSILAHPDERFIGEKLQLVEGHMNEEEIPELEEESEKITRENVMSKFYLFFPDSFFQKDPESDRFYAAVDAGIYGSVFSYGDTYILCGVTLWETWMYIVFRCFFSTLIFFAIAWVFVCYMGFALGWHKEEPKMFRGKLVSYGALAVVILFLGTWYYLTMMDVTGDIATMNDHAGAAVETLNTYQKYRDRLSAWLDKQYLEQGRLAADLVLQKGKENLTRKDMAELAGELGVEYVYVFDKKGKVLVTNSNYDHFKLSKDKEDQSYEFRQLLDGREYLVQEVREDDSSGEKMQYIGVSIRDENDLCDGFVQIAVSPRLRDRLINPINVQTVLDNLVIGIPKYAFAIDKETLKVVAAAGLSYKKVNAEELGVSEEKLKDGFDGIIVINGKNFFASVRESEDYYLIPLTRSTDNANSSEISWILALYGIVAYFLLGLAAMSGYKKVDLAVEAAESAAIRAGNTGKDDKEEARRWGIFSDIFKTEEKTDFDTRWKRQSAVPVDEQTPEMRAGKIIYRILLIFSAALILFETAVLYYSEMKQRVSLDGFSYVLLGNWEKGVNLFAFSFCLFLLCILYVFRELLNQILYRIARISDLKKETIFLLLRNAIKYSCALIFLYVGLAQFGIDTKALWASAGVLSLMIGFGAKDLIGDIIAGLFIIFEGTYKIGDWVTVGDWYGQVQEIGLRYSKIVYHTDTKIFNNSTIRDFINCDDDMAREPINVPIPYEMDLLEIKKLFDREFPIIANKITGIVKAPIYQGVNSFEDSCVTVRVVMFVDPAKRFQALRDLRTEIKLLFDRKNISIPYNHLVIGDYKDEVNTYVDVPDVAERSTAEVLKTK